MEIDKHNKKPHNSKYQDKSTRGTVIISYLNVPMLEVTVITSCFNAPMLGISVIR